MVIDEFFVRVIQKSFAFKMEKLSEMSTLTYISHFMHENDS